VRLEDLDDYTRQWYDRHIGMYARNGFQSSEPPGWRLVAWTVGDIGVLWQIECSGCGQSKMIPERNDEHYVPGNVRWETAAEQGANRQRRHYASSLPCAYDKPCPECPRALALVPLDAQAVAPSEPVR